MRYEQMLPYQIRAAIEDRVPVVLPLGVLEYHGEHMAVGMDTLAVTEILSLLEREFPLVILPPFYYGAASYAVEPPEGKGSVQVGEPLLAFARDLFTSLLRIGFRNIHFIIHHQSENFAAGMPTDLAFKLGARQAIFAHLERERGEGWWGRPELADYYAEHSAGEDPFNWIKGHPLMSSEVTAEYPFDHAGAGETSLMLELCPQVVELERIDQGRWYTSSAQAASPELGRKGRELILRHLRRALHNK